MPPRTSRIRGAIAGFALCAALGFGPALAADHPTFESVWEAVNAKPNHRVIDEPRDVRVELPDEQTIYFFTKPGQPAHPGVIKRSVIVNGAKTAIETVGHSFGDAAAQTAFAALLAKFKAQDAEVNARMHEKP